MTQGLVEKKLGAQRPTGGVAVPLYDTIRADQLQPGDVFALKPEDVVPQMYRWHQVVSVELVHERKPGRRPPPVMRIERVGERWPLVIFKSAKVARIRRPGQVRPVCSECGRRL